MYNIDCEYMEKTECIYMPTDIYIHSFFSVYTIFYSQSMLYMIVWYFLRIKISYTEQSSINK